MNREPQFELDIERHVRAPHEKIWDAFVRPEAMREWMCPRGMTSTVEADVRVGGGFTIVMRAGDGSQYTAKTKYRELVRPERLVYTWQWVGEGMPNVETLITATLQ